MTFPEGLVRQLFVEHRRESMMFVEPGVGVSSPPQIDKPAVNAGNLRDGATP